MTQAKLQYSREIDGLRAYAVLSVLFYHAGFEIFSGGYVGVDVFFVISGYLITRLIRHEVLNGSFTFSNFYIRRVRRLFPAVFVTIAASLIVGYLLFAPADLERLGGSAFYAVLSLSNFFFWLESGYFDASAGSKPLLHTWSLSVEEQFYYVWPICLVLLCRLKNKNLIPVYAAVAGLVSLVLTERMLDNDASGAFFLLPFRVAEFSIGVIAVWAVDRRTSNKHVLEALTIIGMVMIAVATFAFEESTRFPGINSLLPCIGTALVIYGATAPKSGFLLRNRVAVRIGLISYSLYLVHWPVIVFYNYYNFVTPTFVEKFGFVIVSFVLAELMYRFVETPFRLKRGAEAKFSEAGFGLFAALCAIVIAFPAANVWAMKGLPGRFDISTETTDKDIEDQINKSNASVVRRKASGKIVVLGDSIAGDLFNSLLLTQTIKDASNFRLIRRTRGGCRPVIGPSLSSPPESARGKKCERFFAASYDAMIKSNPDIIFMYARWGGVPKYIPELKTRLQKSVNLLLEKTKAQIVFLDYPPDYKKSTMEAAHLLFRMNADKFNKRLEDVRNIDDTNEVDSFLEQLAMENDRITFLKLKDSLCPNNICSAFENGHFMIRDQVHLTSWGRARMAKLLDEEIQNSPLAEVLKN